ncbi:MAG: lipase family protein [Thermonemataceae bacterium]
MNNLKLFYSLLLIVVFVSCRKEPKDGPVDPEAPLAGDPPSETITVQQEYDFYTSTNENFDNEDIISSSLSSDFQSWLQDNGYGDFDFAREELPGGSYGGRTFAGEPIKNQPVIFIHGNSDKAVGSAIFQTGWTASIDYFLSQGYSQAELYAITWGDADILLAANQYHSRANVERIRAFIEAVKAYTGAKKVDVIGHSMGVTLARKAIKGGTGNDELDGGSYDLGKKLSYIDTFVGIAAANRGLVSCFDSSTLLTCGETNGFFPGTAPGGEGLSDFLTDLANQRGKEADHVYTIWSIQDQLIGFSNLVWGQFTSQIPRQDGEIRYDAFPYGHFNCKDLTGPEQLHLVRDHRIY